MNRHSKLSPSSRHRWMLCPASVREGSKNPPQASGPSAIDGTHSHTLLERCVKAGLNDPLQMIGVTLEDHEGRFTVDAERAQRVKVAIDYIRSRAEGCEVNGEEWVDPEFLLGRNDMAGTIDVSMIGNGTLELIDYKDGMGKVDAERNPQLVQYAIGKLASFKQAHNLPFPFGENIRLTIIQPKLASKGMPAIEYWDTTVSEILDNVGHLVAQAAKTDLPNAPFMPGESQCRYCPANGGCKAYSEYAMKSLGITFPTVNEQAAVVRESLPSFIANKPPVDITTQVIENDPSNLPDERLVAIIENAPLVRQMLVAAEEEALTRMKAGKTIPGLKLVNGRGSRNWNEPDDVIAEKLKKMHVPKDSIWKTKLISPAQLEKEAWKNRKDEVCQLSPRQLETVKNEYVTYTAGKLTVALESDERTAVVLDASPMFGAVEKPQSQVPAIPDWLK